MKVIFDVVTAYPFEHNFQFRKRDKERLPELVTAAESFSLTNKVYFRTNQIQCSLNMPLISNGNIIVYDYEAQANVNMILVNGLHRGNMLKSLSEGRFPF